MKIRITCLICFILLFSNYSNSQWFQTNGPEAGVTTAMINVNDILFSCNLDWGRQDGRVYKSTDLGNSWHESDNGISGNKYINAFANIGSVIFAANGTTGVYRTQDFGNSWVPINSGIIGSPLALLAKDSLLFVGLSGPGVWMSTNMGNTWLWRNNGLPQGTVIPYEFAKLGNYIYVGLEGGGGPAPLYRSSNNGEFWEIANTGLPNGSNVHEFTTNGNTLFTSIEGDFGQFEYGLFKSTDFGSSWAAANNGIPYVVGGNAGEIFAHQGIIYLGTTYPAGIRLYKSTNNGESWNPSANGIQNQQAWSFTAGGNYVFAGLGLYSSVYRSSNNGDLWRPARKGIAKSEVYDLIKHSDGRIYAGTFEGLYWTTNSGIDWTEMENGLQFGLPITDMLSTGSNIYLTTTQYGFYRSTNNGSGWEQSNSGITGTFAKYVESITQHNNYLVIGTWDGVFRSTNNGASWETASTGLPTDGGSIVKVNKVFSYNGSLYAGTVLNRVYKSTNNGSSWFNSGSGITVYGSTIHDINVKDNILYLATEGGIYKSSNEGGSWTLITPEGIVRKIITAGNALIASSYGYTMLTGYNIIISTDNGAAWATYNTGMEPNSRVMALMPDGNLLYGGTDTRGVWKRDISTLVSAGNENEIIKDYSLHQNYPNPFNPVTNIKFSIPQRTFVSLKVYDTSGKEIVELAGNEFEQGSYTLQFNSGSIASGVYFYTLKAGSFSETKRMVLMK